VKAKDNGPDPAPFMVAVEREINYRDRSIQSGEEHPTCAYRGGKAPTEAVANRRRAKWLG